MSLLTREHRLSVTPFAAVPALLDLPGIQREPASVSNVSSRLSSMHGNVDLAEGCIITKSVKYTHQLAHMVNAVHSGDPQPIQDVIDDLKVIPYDVFSLNDPCNLVFLEPFVHTSLDLYAFIALAPSATTVNELIAMVKSDNDHRQQQIDQSGNRGRRSLNFSASSFTNPEYELISLHPEHFLPLGAVLTVCDPATHTFKNYMPSHDRCLRESTEPDSPRLPPFRHVLQNRYDPTLNLNIFLVTLNAEIKCRRYLKMIEHYPPLPDDVLALMHRITELVDLLYWEPVPTKGSRGDTILARKALLKRSYPEEMGGSSSKPMPSTATNSDEEGGMEGSTSKKRPRHSRWRLHHFPDVESRKAYGTALMCGHDMDYDPALFEDAFPLDDSVHLYSDNTAMEIWKQGITSEGPSA